MPPWKRLRASYRCDLSRRARLVVWASFASAMGLAAPAAAGNICNETVPANRVIDGIPAYQQCTDSTSSAIYSNNGVDTATSSGGTGWVRTQGSGGYQCTELAHRYLYFRWNVTSVPNGNAGVWCDGTIPNGLVKTTVPVHGDIIVFAPGSCGADSTTGHVAVVDVVGSNGTVTFVEQNRANRRSCAINTAACFLHATANDGSLLDGGTPDVATAPDVGVGLEVRPDRYRDNAAGSGGAAGTGTGGSGGAAGTSGSGGQGGRVAGTGGAVASGGQAAGGATSIGGNVDGSSSGGRGGSGGASSDVTRTGGSTGATSTAAEPVASANNGCSCRLHAGGGGHGGTWLMLALAVGLLLGRPRRPRP